MKIYQHLYFKDKKFGSITYLISGKEVLTVDIVAEKDIKKLKNGDEIIYSTEKGERKYKVVVNKIIEETDWQYIKNTKDNRITLITCEINKRAYRRCIQAIESI